MSIPPQKNRSRVSVTQDTIPSRGKKKKKKDGALLGKGNMCECGFRIAHLARPHKKKKKAHQNKTTVE